MHSALVLTQARTELEAQITESFENLRKESPQGTDQWYRGGKEQFQKRLHSFIQKDSPIEFLLPAFPGKSQNNETKVLSAHADLAEEVAIKTIESFVTSIESIYGKGGVLFRILSDGYVFGPSVGISDENVAVYERECRSYLNNPNILWQNLSFFFPQGNYKQKREQLKQSYAPQEDELDAMIRSDPKVNRLYCGMQRFMKEDIKPSESKKMSATKKKKQAKEMARNIMTQNIAYTRLHQERLGHCIRLSIHPCENYGEKFSINLIPGDNTWATPWHRSPVVTASGQVVLMKRAEAEKSGYQLIERNGRPYTFRES